MTLAVWLWIIFWLVNVLDGFTTYLCLFKLPVELRAKEANPLFKKFVGGKFGTAMFIKFLVVAFGTYLFLYIFRQHPGQGISAFILLDLVVGLAVINNTYIYISRLKLKKITPTPISYFSSLFVKNLKFPQKMADTFAYFVVIGLSYGICMVVLLALLS